MTTNMMSTNLGPPFARATLSISGMTCSSCSNDLQHGLGTLDYVKSCNVSALTNTGIVIFDQSFPGSIQQIIQLIEDKGYDCSLQGIENVSDTKDDHNKETERRTRSVKLAIEGMSSQQCPIRITTELSKRFSQTVKIMHPLALEEKILTITYEPDSPKLTIRSIIQCIEAIDTSFRIRPYYPRSVDDESRTIQHQEQKDILWRVCLTALIALPTLMIGIVWMSLVSENNSIRRWFEEPVWAGNTSRMQWSLFFLATPVYFVSASKFHVKATKEILSLWRKRSHVPVLRRFYRFGSMNLLISAGTTVAYFASLVSLILTATFHGSGQSTTYFDSVVFLTFFILIGRYLEAVSKAKAGDAVSMLGQLKPENALLVVSEDESVSNGDVAVNRAGGIHKASANSKEISADLLEIGDIVRVLRGSTPPADGILASAEGRFDESSLTGESTAVRKKLGDPVFLGTINAGDPVNVTVTEICGSSMLDQIIAVVREGQTKRAPVEHIADTITAYFVPVITLLAILTFFVWFGLGQSGFLDASYISQTTGGWAFWSLEFAIAVFVVACPCGIGLAAPTALFVGSGLAAKAGILVRGGGEAFQNASRVDAVVFDKTGTLTEGGDLKVTDWEMVHATLGLDESLRWSMTCIIEQNSAHPIAKAIAKLAAQYPGTPMEPLEITEIPGQGMRAVFKLDSATGSKTYEAILGSESLIKSYEPDSLANDTFVRQTLQSWKTNCKSIAILAIRDLNTSDPWQISTLFALSDPIRPSAVPTIAALQAQGTKTYMLSGDNAETARAVALAVGIPIANVFAGALPQDKAARIEQLKQDLAVPSKRQPPFTRSNPARQARIAFVGDGINDAPALLAATVSISLSTGSPIAFTSSSFILLTPSLESIVTLLHLSKKVFRRVRWNFAWALVYNVILIPVAAGVLFRVRDGGFVLGPVWAAAAMALSSLSVVLASLALRWGF